MWSFLLGTLIGGILGWLLYRHLSSPLERFAELRSYVSEALLFTSDISHGHTDPDRYDEVAYELRRLAVELDVFQKSNIKPVDWYLRSRGYKLTDAVRALIGLSNSLSDETEQKAMYENDIERALKLTLSYSER